MNHSPSEQFLQGIGGRVREQRMKRDWSLTNLSLATDLSRAHLCDIENGRTEPGAGCLLRLAIAFKCSVDWLVRGDGIKE